MARKPEEYLTRKAADWKKTKGQTKADLAADHRKGSNGCNRTNLQTTVGRCTRQKSVE
jgi:hypothetical protein